MKAKIKKTSRITFKVAVEGTPDVCTCFKPGLTALGNYSSKISVSDSSKLAGSLDIDLCTLKLCPQANRWDYAFDYNNEVFFVEVHSANTSEVKVVLKKYAWLKDWLNQKAPNINKLKATSKPAFYWIQSGKFAILPSSSQYREIVAAGLKPISNLTL